MQDNYYRNILVPSNKQRMDILYEIKSEHQPLTLDEIKEHENEYL